MDTRHKKLNDKQIHILKLLFKFRFLTAPLLARYKDLTKDSVNKSLKVLLEQEYIGRKYNKNYKLLGKAAEYFLAPKALRLLRDEHGLDPVMLHSMYKNKSVSEAFINQSLAICELYLRLNTAYPVMFDIYTKTELASLDYVPSPAPSLLLERKHSSSKDTNTYFLDIFDNIPFFVIKKRLQLYVDHLDSGDWEQPGYPTLLLVVETSAQEYKVLKEAERLLNAGDELDIMTTTKKSLLAPIGESGVWSKPESELLHGL